jgi:hypothetical protein
VISLKLISKGIPYWQRPDLGFSADDVRVHDGQISATVHSVGATSTPPTKLVLLDQSGAQRASVAVPQLEAPLDLFPRKTSLTITLPENLKTDGCTLLIDPELKLKEITRVNNTVKL